MLLGVYPILIFVGKSWEVCRSLTLPWWSSAKLLLSTCWNKDQGFFYSKEEFFEELFVKEQAFASIGEREILWTREAINQTHDDVSNCLKMIKKLLWGMENKFWRGEQGGFCISNPCELKWLKSNKSFEVSCIKKHSAINLLWINWYWIQWIEKHNSCWPSNYS